MDNNQHDIFPKPGCIKNIPFLFLGIDNIPGHFLRGCSKSLWQIEVRCHFGGNKAALLGRIPSAVGYQPTLATDMGNLQERITSTTKGSITSVQAIYVPADDLTDPAPATTFSHLDATVVLSRAITELGIYPAVA